MTAQREANKKTVTDVLEQILNSSSRTDRVLDFYDAIKDRPEREGVCHDLAVALMQDLAERGVSHGWTWCRGPVFGGIDHSWIEHGGWCIDMGDDDQLRVWEAAVPQIQLDGPVERRDSQQTRQWIEEREEAWTKEASYFIWRKQGCRDGNDLGDWFAARRELGLP